MFDTLSGDLFQKLKIFHYAFHYGSIGKAAVAIHRSPSSVSRQIQQLEEELGLTLLRRNARGVVPTPEGKELYAQTLTLFQNLEGLLRSISAPQKVEGPSGVVRVLAAPLVIDSALPRILPEMARRYPGIRLELSASHGLRSGMKSLIAHDYHFLLSAHEDHMPFSLDFQPLFTTTICLISPAGCPLPEGLEHDPRLLETLPFIDMQKGLAVAGFIHRHCEALGVRLNIRHMASRLSFQVDMVKAGLGVALVDRTHLEATDTRGVTIVPMPFFPPRSFGLFQRRNAFQPPHVRAVIELIFERVRNAA